MNIMHNKTEKFITQLRHATHGERRHKRPHSKVSKCRIIRQPKLDKFQSQCYSKCYSNADVCATDRQRRRSLSLKPVKASSATRQRALGAHQLK